MKIRATSVGPMCLGLLVACSSSPETSSEDGGDVRDSAVAVSDGGHGRDGNAPPDGPTKAREAGDEHSAAPDAESRPCATTSVAVTVVDYFSGASVPAATFTIDGADAGTSPFCLGPGVHPASIQASGYATYNGAIQLPGGSVWRTVRLFPVGASLAGWFALVNSDRQANDASPVGLDNGLTIAAWDHAVDMGVQGYYAHFDPHGFGPPTRSLMLGSMLMGAENIYASPATYEDADMGFMAEKASLPNQAPSDCAASPASALHYCNIVATSHNWVGLGIVSVPGSPWTTYYDQEFGDLYGYFDTTVLGPEPPLSASGSVILTPAPGYTFTYEYAQTLAAPTPISIAVLNADPECNSMCPAGDVWYPSGNTSVSTTGVEPYMPTLSESQIVFVALATNLVPFLGASAYAAFWGGTTTTPDSYGASAKSYLVP